MWSQADGMLVSRKEETRVENGYCEIGYSEGKQRAEE